VQEFADPEQIEVAVGGPFAVLLSGNGAGGYLWRVAEVPEGVRVWSEDDLPPGEAAPGATGTRRFELEATEPGTFGVRFELRRSWEPGAERVRDVTVRAVAS
jgi:predicted secreted protein